MTNKEKTVKRWLPVVRLPHPGIVTHRRAYLDAYRHARSGGLCRAMCITKLQAGRCFCAPYITKSPFYGTEVYFHIAFRRRGSCWGARGHAEHQQRLILASWEQLEQGVVRSGLLPSTNHGREQWRKACVLTECAGQAFYGPWH
jgi:hypothetical protein